MSLLNHHLGALLGRVFFGLIFLIAGVSKVIDFSGTASYMASHGLPMSEILLVLAIIVELGGALMVVFGWNARYGALLLALFVLAVTFVFHSFWTYENVVAATNQMHHFLKNLAMFGGALYIMAFGAGKYSLDGK